MAKNTTENINSPKVDEKELEQQIKNAANAFKAEKLVDASIPKNYLKSIGPTLPIGINGVFIVLPVDGTKHKIPQSFKDHLDAYLDNLTV